MGIKELGTFLNNKCPNAIYDIKLSDKSCDKSCDKSNNKSCDKSNNKYNNKSNTYIAVDTSLFMYKFKYSNGEKFIIKFIEMINRLKINKITPIFIFDGAPPLEKIETIEKRKKKKNEYKEQLSILNEQKNNSKNIDDLYNINEQIKKLNKKIIYVTKDNIKQLKYLLNILNIPYIHENIEADLISSKLSSSNILTMVLSEDMDHLTNGTQYLIRDFNVNNNVAKCYDLEKIKNILEINNIQFINLCVLFGCDYLKRIKGLGTISSFNIIKTLQSYDIEEIIKRIKQTKNVIIPENYISEFNKAVSIFKNENINLEKIIIHNAKLQDNKIVLNPLFDNSEKNAYDYLKKYTNLSETKIRNRLSNIFN